MAHTPQKRKRYLVTVDREACKECGYCIEVCPREVFSQTDSFNAKGYRPVQVQSVESCIGCKRCFFACPDFAIDVKEEQAKEEQDEKNF